MKLLGFINLSILIFSFSTVLRAQEKCTVLKPEISQSYEGKCKNGFANGKGTASGIDHYQGMFRKGLPHGEGTYTWSTGEVYTGDWSDGLRQGYGIQTHPSNGNDSIQSGMWKNDQYLGPKPKSPNVLYNSGVVRNNFQKNNTTKSRVLIDIYQNGTRNQGVSNFMISASSGNDTKTGQSVGYDNVTFPVTVKVMYTTWNKLHTMQTNIKFDFEIFESGDWTVELHN